MMQDMAFFAILLAADVAREAVSHGASAFGFAEILTVLKFVLTLGFMLAGLFFVFAGTLGVLRLPDFYTRLHAAGMTDTLGSELILLALIVQSGISQMSFKLILVGFFLFITSPTATHAVAHAAFRSGLEPLTGPFEAEEIKGAQE